MSIDSDKHYLDSELDVNRVLGKDGVIGQYIDGFESRESQLGMAQLIDEAIALGESRVIEASTCIGKSFAYLVPAFLNASKVIISTGTRNLQDQLYQKDIPLVRKTIVSSKKTALLKGRSNYACPYRIRKYKTEDRFKTRHLASLFGPLSRWSDTSENGDSVRLSLFRL